MAPGEHLLVDAVISLEGRNGRSLTRFFTNQGIGSPSPCDDQTEVDPLPHAIHELRASRLGSLLWHQHRQSDKTRMGKLVQVPQLTDPPALGYSGPGMRLGHTRISWRTGVACTGHRDAGFPTSHSWPGFTKRRSRNRAGWHPNFRRRRNGVEARIQLGRHPRPKCGPTCLTESERHLPTRDGEGVPRWRRCCARP